MSFSRRALFGGLGAAATPLSGALIAARGREALVAESWPNAIEATLIPLPQDGEIRISSNENPLGPAPDAVAAIQQTFATSNRYPMNTPITDSDLRNSLAAAVGTDAGNVILGAGSGEILKNTAHATTSGGQAIVTAAPSYGDPVSVARYFGAEVRAPRVDDEGKIDLDAMAEAAPGAGMVYVCQPNNPTGTVHSADSIGAFVAKVRQAAPEAVILIDEAYHEYVTDPSYATAIPLALETPNVIVTRTFSKAYGMAGMRIGWAVAHPELAATMRRYELTMNTNVLGIAAADASLRATGFIPQELQRNTEAKQFTVDFFTSTGYDVWDSQTNFIFVNIRRPASDFRDACAAHDVRVGRDFPPLEQTHARISIGTMEEMERATDVFAQVLEVTAPVSGGI